MTMTNKFYTTHILSRFTYYTTIEFSRDIILEKGELETGENKSVDKKCSFSEPLTFLDCWKMTVIWIVKLFTNEC